MFFKNALMSSATQINSNIQKYDLKRKKKSTVADNVGDKINDKPNIYIIKVMYIFEL